MRPPRPRLPQHRPLDRRHAVAGTFITVLAFALALAESDALPSLPPGGGTLSVTVTVSVLGATPHAAPGVEHR